MKQIHINAVEIMNSSDPFQALCALFDAEARTPEELSHILTTRIEPVIAEVGNWPADGAEWEKLADLLEGIQQHSSTFYLIWGTKDDMVDPKAIDPQDELTDPEWV